MCIIKIYCENHENHDLEDVYEVSHELMYQIQVYTESVNTNIRTLCNHVDTLTQENYI